MTSASLMVRAPAAPAAAALLRTNPRVGVGLYIDMGESVMRDGQWIAIYEYVIEGDADAAASELRAQVALFQQLTGRPPDHLDSHHHVHLSRPELSEAVSKVADELDIGIRSLHPRVTYRGMYARGADNLPLPEAIRVDAYVAAIKGHDSGVVLSITDKRHVDRDERENLA